MKTALDDSTIEEIRRRKRAGETTMQLALVFHVHYRTIENYCRKPNAVKQYRGQIMSKFMAVR
jgi:hypothetical protein